MDAFFDIFVLAIAGSVIRWAVSAACRLAARKSAGHRVALDGGRSRSSDDGPPADPVFTFGFTLACYGALALGWVAALPGPLALQRTCLAFAFLGVGGLLGEIAAMQAPAPEENSAVDEETATSDWRRSACLSVLLTLVLNIAFAVLSFRQGLIEIVPPASSASSAQLAPIVVVAERTRDPVEQGNGF